MNKQSALAKKILAWRIKLGYKILPPLNWKSGWNRSSPVEPVPILPEPAPNESEVQRRIRIATEKCATQPRKGDFLHEYLKAAGITAKPEPVVHHTPSERLDTLLPARLRQNTPIPGISELTTSASPSRTAQAEVAAIPTTHDASDWYPGASQRHTDAITRLPIENGITPLSPWEHREEQHTGAFLLDDVRDTIFEDVPALGESLDEDDMPTVLHPRTRFKNAMSQLLPAPERE